MMLDNLPTVLTQCGVYFNFLDPFNSEVNPEDIAHALANTCRFGGHTREFYSVAQHCVLMADYAPSGMELDALYHKATEVYIGDIPSPLRYRLPYYQSVEASVERAICSVLGLRWPIPECIKELDRRLWVTEMRDLFPPHISQDEWGLIDAVPFVDEIKPLPPAEAKELFLDRVFLYG